MRRKLFIGCFSVIGILVLGTVIFVALSLYFISQEYRSPEELADPDGQFADVDGVRIYYLAEGERENPAVVLIHGFGGSTFTWRDNMDALEEAGYYVVALDLPPFGLSDKSAEIAYSRADLAGYVAGLMDELGIESATIVGHSMGATVASYFLLNYPERVDKIVFVDGGIFEARTSNRRDEDSPLAFLNEIDPASPIAADILRLTLRPNTFAEIMSSAYYDPEFITDEMVAGYARPLKIADWPNGFLGFLQAEQSQSLSLAELAELVRMPCLIIWGENDSWIPLASGEEMLEALPDARMIRYPQVGHLPMEENVEGFNADLISFLAE